MSYSNIDKSTNFFNTKLYTGNGSTQSISSVGFQPDWTWIKQRNGTGWHNVYDAVRGSTKRLQTNDTGAESTITNSITSFDSDGFSLGSNGDTNGSSNTTVSWNWKANGAGSANTDGTINTTVSANTTSGFSIISYTGTGGTSQTLGHSLGVKPKMFIVKCRSNAGEYWGTWIDTDGDGTSNYRMSLNATDAAYGSDPISFSNSLITLPSSANTQWNGSGRTYVGYAFAEKQGYSKFGSYTGNGNDDGIFCFTGMKPSFVMIKRTDSSASWLMFDNKRANPFNEITADLRADLNNAEDASTSYNNVDFLSNGFKIRKSNADINASGGSYFYMAFGQSLVGSNNIPCTAR